MDKKQFFRQRVLPLLFAIALFVFWRYQESTRIKAVAFQGKTMGTTYSVKYRVKGGENYQQQIDSILIKVNESLSTYIPDSEISRFNQNMELKFELPFFYPILVKSKQIFQKTEGAFDPTIMPLVYAWGFGPGKKQLLDSATVDSLLHLVSFEHIDFTKEKVWKDTAGVQLDFSSIAKGFGVDKVADFLNKNGVEHFLVEIGGEVVCKGESQKGKIWRIGIDDPNAAETGNAMKAAVTLKNRALATSGNYRNYYVKDGVKYAHTISPYTGFPVQHTLLSASVFASDCASADAYATSFMVMGLEKAKKVLEKDPKLDAYLIYSDQQGNIKTFITEGIRPFINE